MYLGAHARIHFCTQVLLMPIRSEWHWNCISRIKGEPVIQWNSWVIFFFFAAALTWSTGLHFGFLVVFLFLHISSFDSLFVQPSTFSLQCFSVGLLLLSNESMQRGPRWSCSVDCSTFMSKPPTCRSSHQTQDNCLEAAAVVFVFPAEFLWLDLAAGTILPGRYCTCIYNA